MEINVIEVSPFLTNCFIVSCEKTQKGIVIDPGDEVDMIIDEIEKKKIIVEKIVNTHGHIDHAGGIKELQQRLDIPFFLHKDDLPYINHLNEIADMYGMKILGIPEVNGYLKEGEEITIGDGSLRVIHTPGHTPGGVCLMDEEVLFSGDTLFRGSIGRTDLPGGDYDVLIRSIKEKLMVLDEELTVHTGHGPSTTIGFEKHNNPFL
ncbi:MBL fold metallo-hydrolase [candidate division KSB1 bacterium]